MEPLDLGWLKQIIFSYMFNERKELLTLGILGVMRKSVRCAGYGMSLEDDKSSQLESWEHYLCAVLQSHLMYCSGCFNCSCFDLSAVEIIKLQKESVVNWFSALWEEPKVTEDWV